MRAFRISFLILLVLATRGSAQTPTHAAATITPEDVQKRIAFLASDSLRGRATPSPGLELAAAYVAREFKALGLKPAGDSGSFIQRWPFKRSNFDAKSVKAELRGPTPRTLVYGKEYFVIPSATVDTVTGDVVYGGVAGANSIASSHFANNIVAFFVPGAMPDSAWEAELQSAFVSAMTGGARGIVFILDPLFQESIIGMVAQMASNQSTPLPLIALRYDVARAWLRTLNVNLDSARSATVPDALGQGSLFLRTSQGGVVDRPPNVVGILEGSDPALKNTYVVYSAHIDHVGVGQPDATGDSIYNGADDDASGTSAVIEIAEAFVALNPKPKRSVIFLLVSGEENGLFGSQYFVNNPPVPAQQMVANINIDMIGRNAPDTTVAIGLDYTTLGHVMQNVNRAHPELGLTVAPDLWPEENLFVRSDHFNFAKARIPAIFFTSGLHADYHKPSDEPETIDNDKLARTARLLFFLGYDVANNTAAPTWTEAGLQLIRGN